MAGQAPAQQRFRTDDAAVAQVDLRLIEHDQLVALQRTAQLALQHQPLDRGRVHLRRIEGEAVAAVLLRVVHRRVGVADQVDHVLRVLRTERDTDARGQEHFLLIDVVRLADLGKHHAREVRRFGLLVLLFGEALDEQAELVAREPADDGFLRQDVREPFAQYFQRAIARGMSEGVVDLLEPIHVEIQQHDAAVVATRARDRLLQHVLELHPVRHFGQRVVARQVADAALGALAVRDVAHDEDRALELRIFGCDRCARQRHRNRLAAARRDHGLPRVERRRFHRECCALVLRQQHRERPAGEIFLAVAEQPHGRVVDALDDAVRRRDEHGVVHAVEHARQVVLRDRRLLQLLPHAIERHFQVGDLVVARDLVRPRVVAFADALGRADQLDDRPLETLREHPGDDCQQHRDQCAGADDHPHLACEAALLDMLQLRAQRRRRAAQSRARSRQFDRAEQLQIAKLAPHRALLFGSKRAGPRTGAARFEQQRTVRTQHTHRDGRMIFEERVGYAANRIFVAGTQGIFERGCSCRGEIARECVETLGFGSEERALALIADGGAGLAKVDVFQNEQRRGDSESREKRDQK